MLPPVGSAHLCDIRVHSCRIFNQLDSGKTSKAALSVSQGSSPWVLDLSSHMQERFPAWFIVRRSGFKKNFYPWSSEASLASRNFLVTLEAICAWFASEEELLRITAASHKTTGSHRGSPSKEPRCWGNTAQTCFKQRWRLEGRAAVGGQVTTELEQHSHLLL